MEALVTLASAVYQDRLDVVVEEKISRRNFLIMLVKIIMASHFMQFLHGQYFF